jgi:hypothetical protein
VLTVGAAPAEEQVQHSAASVEQVKKSVLAAERKVPRMPEPAVTL